MWSIQLLGGLAAHSPQRQLTRFRTQKAASLLAYLAFHPAPQPRERLIDMLWPDAEPEVGRHNLSNALSFLRHQLEPPGVPPGTVVLADRASVRLNPAAVTVDAGEFENDLRQAQAERLSEDERLTRLLGAIERYGGTLLPGYYEEWIALEALRLESLFVQGVVALVPRLLGVGRREQALGYAQRAVSADPLSEKATLCLMQALVASGQSGQALRACRQLERRLEEELDAEPSPEFLRLAEQLGQGGSSGSVSIVPKSVPPTEEGFALVSASRTKAAPAEPVLDTAVVRSVPPARLLGGEFLLRTTTRFFGREKEIERLGKLLSTPRTRLVTLTGSGGTGKTRLALEVAAHLVERAEDLSLEDAPTSAVFVPLASVTEADRLFDVALRALGLVPATHQNPLDQLASALEARPNTLLVLDNFEQLVEEGALRVRDLLGRAVGVKLLITSRQRLHIEGEREFHLAPLPTSAGEQTLEALLDVPSIVLFVDRAQAALPDFQLTDRNAAAVSQLCDYLEGIPLVIELAAARVAVLSPARILEQVQSNRLDFLTTRKRDAESRQRTLRATLDWSYHLLPEAAQTSLATLSVFRGGWTLDAAEVVCALDEEEMLERLTVLRDSSLINVTDTEEGQRFTLLETVREYTCEQLNRSGNLAAVSARHRDYFLTLAEDMALPLAAWLDQMELESANLRSALSWCLACGGANTTESDSNLEPPQSSSQAQIALRMCFALRPFWSTRGLLSEGRAWCERALSADDAQERTSVRAKLLLSAGILAVMQGDYVFSRSYFEESLGISREIGDRRGIANSLNNLGMLAFEHGDYTAAQTYHEEGLEIRREMGDRQGSANSFHNLGQVAEARGDYSAAQALYLESLTIRRESGNRLGMVIALDSLGNVARLQGDFANARALHAESLSIRREIGDRQGVPESLNAFAYLIAAETTAVTAGVEAASGTGQTGVGVSKAVRLWAAAQALREQIGAVLRPNERENYDQHLSQARSALGEDAFAVAWEEGRAMTQEQAVAYALEEGAVTVE